MKHSSRKPLLKAPDKTEQMACIQLFWTSATNSQSLLFSPTQTSLPFALCESPDRKVQLKCFTVSNVWVVFSLCPLLFQSLYYILV